MANTPKLVPKTTAPSPVKVQVLVHGKILKTVDAQRACCIKKKGAK